MIEQTLDTPYGVAHAVRYSGGWFVFDREMKFENKRIRRKRPIRGIHEKLLLKRVVMRWRTQY